MAGIVAARGVAVAPAHAAAGADMTGKRIAGSATTTMELTLRPVIDHRLAVGGTRILLTIAHVPNRCGRSSASFRISSANSAFAHANHERVNCAASSFQNDSCMKPAPACDRFELLEAVDDLPIIGAGQRAHDDRHRPDPPDADVRAADAVPRAAVGEKRVVAAEDVPSACAGRAGRTSRNTRGTAGSEGWGRWRRP